MRSNKAYHFGLLPLNLANPEVSSYQYLEYISQMLKQVRTFEQISKIITRLRLQDVYLTTLLEFVRIKQLRSNMLRDVALYIACLHLSNTSSIILIDNGWLFQRTICG